MNEDQKFIFNRSLYNVRETILRPRTIDAALISMGMNITGPIIELAKKFPDMDECIKWSNEVLPLLMEEANLIMKNKNSIKNDEEKWKNELEKFIVPLEEYSAWFKLKNNE